MMSKNKEIFFIKFIIDIVMIISSFFKIIPNLIFIFEYEAKAAGKSLISIIVLFLMASIFLLTIWMSILVMCVFYLVSLHMSWLLSIFIITMMNIILLLITAICISRMKRPLAFEKTRNLIHKFKK